MQILDLTGRFYNTNTFDLIQAIFQLGGPLPERVLQLVVCRQKVYSNTALTFYEVNPDLEN